MSNELQELIIEFKKWINFTRSLQELPEAVWELSLEEGKWTVRDIVSHIMLWDKYFYEEAIDKIAHYKPVTLKHLNFDEFNSKAIVYGRTITTSELIGKTIYYREKIIQDINALSEELVRNNYIDGDGNVFHIPQYIKDFIWHDQHHMNPLKTFLITIEQ
jgi:hypothetical protein